MGWTHYLLSGRLVHWAPKCLDIENNKIFKFSFRLFSLHHITFANG